MGGVFTKLIDSNTTIPTRQSQVFSTAVDNQPSVEIHVLQGERPMSSDNKTIGRFHLDGLPPARRGTPQIEVVFDIDANGIINVSAIDKATDKKQSIRIESSTGLSKEEIQKMKQDAELNAESDKKKKEDVETLNTADNLMFQTEKTLSESENKIPSDKKTEIDNTIKELRQHHLEKNIPMVEKLMGELNEQIQKVVSVMYESKEPQDNSTENSGENLTDVEFENVK